MSAPASRKAYSKRNGAVNGRNASSAKGLLLSSNGEKDTARAVNGTLLSADALENEAVFTQLIEIAERAGRFDLVEEFRRRAAGDRAPAADSDPQSDESFDEPIPAGASEGPAHSIPQPAAMAALAKEGLRLLKVNKPSRPVNHPPATGRRRRMKKAPE
jgi:hypothetical protein